MAKRYINKQQQQRIQRHQQKLLADTETTIAEAGLVIARYGKDIIVEDLSQQPILCKQRQHIGHIVVGDHVLWKRDQHDSGVILALKPRHSLFARPGQEQLNKATAANVDQIFIVTAPIPTPIPSLIDSYLVAAELLHIKPFIVINKCDLPNDTTTLTTSIYQTIGYPCITTSTLTQAGIDTLSKLSCDKVSVFVGQSGVGKSSLIQQLLGHSIEETAAIHANTHYGKHATTTTRLYHIEGGGDLIDSPGIREFGLWKIDIPTLAQHFIEFRAFIPQCKFNDCLHLHEPTCAVRAAVTTNLIAEQRYANYQRLAEELQICK